jgi:hypothetical protein
VVTLPIGETYVVWANGSQNKPTSQDRGEWVSVVGLTKAEYLHSYLPPLCTRTGARRIAINGPVRAMLTSVLKSSSLLVTCKIR